MQTANKKIKIVALSAGAAIKYNPFTEVFECEYCGNIVYDKFSGIWKLIDIELDNDKR